MNKHFKCGFSLAYKIFSRDCNRHDLNKCIISHYTKWFKTSLNFQLILLSSEISCGSKIGKVCDLSRRKKKTSKSVLGAFCYENRRNCKNIKYLCPMFGRINKKLKNKKNSMPNSWKMWKKVEIQPTINRKTVKMSFSNRRILWRKILISCK